jgi:predicted membrane channel-forming protein YqfA (hemolysin III family)
MHVLLALIGVCVVCMSIVYVAHEEVGSIYVAAFFQAAFAYVAFSSAQFHINRRDKKRLKLKVKKEMKGR